MRGIISNALISIKQLTIGTLSTLFAPLVFLFTSFKRLWPRRFFNRRASAWSSPAMSTSQHRLNEGLFRAPPQGRASPQVILRPVNGLFILATLVVALLLNLLPWGNWHWVPDFLAITLMFWISREPRLVGFGIAFLCGLLMDVHDGTVLGEHALSYVILAYAANLLSRRLPSFDLPSQALHIWPVFLGAQLVAILVRGFFGGYFPSLLTVLIAPTLQALLWPMVTWLMLAPQRTPLNIDQNRPL
jgi:rod shape-determining protein MreD